MGDPDRQIRVGSPGPSNQVILVKPGVGVGSATQLDDPPIGFYTTRPVVQKKPAALAEAFLETSPR